MRSNTGAPQQLLPQGDQAAPQRRPKAEFYRLSLSSNGLKLAVARCPSDVVLDKQAIQDQTHADIMALFSTARAHTDRLIYSLAGKIFSPQSPLPFGGPRTKPGYVNFKGKTTESLVQYIVTEMYRVYWISKIRTVLKFVVSSVNYILECQRNGMKDELDELMLRGLKKSGHADWYGAQYIPDRLRHREEDSVVPPGIEFSVKGRYGMRREDSISNSSESPANSNSASEFTMSLSGSNSGSIGGGSSGGSSNGGSQSGSGSSRSGSTGSSLNGTSSISDSNESNPLRRSSRR